MPIYFAQPEHTFFSLSTSSVAAASSCVSALRMFAETTFFGLLLLGSLLSIFRGGRCEKYHTCSIVAACDLLVIMKLLSSRRRRRRRRREGPR